MRLSREQLTQYEGVVNLVVKAAAVEPRVDDQAGPECLAVREIDWIDRVQIFNWANGVTTTLRPFRGNGQTRAFDAS